MRTLSHHISVYGFGTSSLQQACPATAGGESVDVLIRRTPDTGNPMEIRVAVIGNVDSGKSTMVGVLTRSMLDDGRGLARSKVFKHGHEEATGRTSSIGQHNLCVSLHVHFLCYVILMKGAWCMSVCCACMHLY